MTTSVDNSNDTTNSYETRIYQNNGNHGLINLLDEKSVNILDIGCGAGDNAKLILVANKNVNINGITFSSAEARIAQQYMKNCWIADIERDIPADILNMQFDALIFSHVLEHVREPAKVIARYVNLLREGGVVLIAVPNVLSWRLRIQFLLGRFEYESAGTLDETHLRFFTFDSSVRCLLHLVTELQVVSKTAEGSVPLWVFRRYVLPKCVSGWIDRAGCRYFPNLFGWQILIKAIKRKSVL